MEKSGLFFKLKCLISLHSMSSIVITHVLDKWSQNDVK